MMWLTWRQQRLEALIGGAILVLLAIFLLWSGLDMASTYQTRGVAACLTSHAPVCDDTISAFRNQYGTLASIIVWLNLLPLVFGVLLAAPFALELELGTYRLVWTQGITRMRWVTVKLCLLVGAAIVASLALTVLLTWWRTPLDHLDGPFAPHGFDVEGMVPLAYTVFAVALGLAVGTLLRRTIPAVAMSLVGFLVLRLGVEGWVRPSYVPPLVTAVTTGGLQRADWVLGNYFRDRQGHHMNWFDVLHTCGVAHGQNAVGISPSCLQQHGIVNVVSYHPGNRFWLFQGFETAIFLGLSAGLLALTVWWVRERIA